MVVAGGCLLCSFVGARFCCLLACVAVFGLLLFVVANWLLLGVRVFWWLPLFVVAN